MRVVRDDTRWDDDRFVTVWPDVARRLGAYLARRGVPAPEADDIAQEVAMRAMRARVPFSDASDLLPWACTVAWRIRISDARRAASKREDPGAVEVISDQSVEDEVLARLRLSEVARTMAGMAERDRRALLRAITGTTPGPPGSAQEAVIRHRARLKLISALGGLGAGVGWVVHRLRWTGSITLVATLAVATSMLVVPGPAAPDPEQVVLGPGVSNAHTAAVAGTRPEVATTTAAAAQRPRATPARQPAGSSPTTTVILQVTGGPHPIGVTEWKRRPTDHLFCTGSFVLLPNFCLG